MIQEIVNTANQFVREHDNLDAKTLAVIAEINQLWSDYLDELETAPLFPHTDCVTVKVDDTTIRFNNTEDFSAWITSA